MYADGNLILFEGVQVDGVDGHQSKEGNSRSVKILFGLWLKNDQVFESFELKALRHFTLFVAHIPCLELFLMRTVRC